MPKRPAPRPSHEFAVTLGGVLRAARKRKKLSLKVLAAQAGLSQAAVVHIESGRHYPSFPHLLLLSSIYDLPAWLLFKIAQDQHLRNPPCPSPPAPAVTLS